MNIERVIFNNLVTNETYARKTIPFLKGDYFQDRRERVVYDIIDGYISKYNALPSKAALSVELSNTTKISEDDAEVCQSIIDEISEHVNVLDEEWLLENTEKFCQDKALYNAIFKSIKIMDDKSGESSTGAIPQLLSDALAVSFDTSIGHEFIDDAEARFDFYHRKEERIPFDLDYLNKITGGGVPKKTLNILLAGCVHPSTKITIRKRIMSDWEYCEVCVGDMKEMLSTHDVEVTSPDGWVSVLEYVDKGEWEEYLLTTSNGMLVRCNENHLFKVDGEWVYAKDLVGTTGRKINTVFGASDFNVFKTGNKIPIVDISIGHENQRYFSAGVESHNTAVGKSLVMCHMAAANLLRGLNVLYITMEMSEEKIAERIDANLLDTPIQELRNLSRDTFKKKIGRLQEKTKGKLIIKEYPTSSAGAANFRHLLNELKIKKSFTPDVIYIDYLNICCSSRIKQGANVNSYIYIKAIAEELRGLASEFNVPIWSATQTTRGGFDNSDPSITDTSESFGLPATADLMLALISTDELKELNQIMIKQLKNRYNDPEMYKRFVIGVDKSRMRLYDADSTAQEGIFEGPTFDSTPFGGKSKFDTNKFSDFK